MTAHSLAEIQIDQCIAAEHHKGVVEEWLEGLDLLQAAGGADGITNQLAILDAALEAVSDFHAEPLTIAEIVFDLLGQVGHVHHDLGEPVLPQQLK